MGTKRPACQLTTAVGYGGRLQRRLPSADRIEGTSVRLDLKRIRGGWRWSIRYTHMT